MIEVKSYKTGKPGAHVLLLGGVHGDEPAGTLGLNRLISELETGSLKMVAGQVDIVAKANPQAASLNRRYVSENLNRLFMPHARPVSYEQALANQLLPLIAQADYTLDLHATTAPTPPFAFLDQPDEKHRQWAQSVELDYLLTGWPQLYAGSGEVTSTEYAQQQGRAGLTVECGQKTDPASSEVAYRAALLTLNHLGLCAATPASSKAVEVQMTCMRRKQGAGKLQQPWQNFSPCKAGDVIARYENGQSLLADESGCVIMPNEAAANGEEWFYLARFAA